MRRQLVPALVAIVLFTVLTLAYAVGTAAASSVLFKHKAEGSLVKDASGRVVGSSLIGQDFTKAKYFHPRPAADGYVPGAVGGGTYSYGSNYGPTNPALIGNQPGVNLDGPNPYATKADPYCVPVPSTDNDDNPITDAKGNPVYDKNKDGSYVCDANTVPERVLAYRAENHLGLDVPVPVDAVTASGSGLDPAITVANAKLQAPRVARARHLPLREVMRLVRQNTIGRALAILGEPAVNVLKLNLALDKV
ncbi:MAG TPA: potassium-transporting ATPase subunit C [Acidimicrobiales bacterium]|nr:potassium-transporting ATPase subunit C [Acidimicrobiales bacterium]